VGKGVCGEWRESGGGVGGGGGGGGVGANHQMSSRTEWYPENHTTRPYEGKSDPWG